MTHVAVRSSACSRGWRSLRSDAADRPGDVDSPSNVAPTGAFPHYDLELDHSPAGFDCELQTTTGSVFAATYSADGVAYMEAQTTPVPGNVVGGFVLTVDHRTPNM